MPRMQNTIRKAGKSRSKASKKRIKARSTKKQKSSGRGCKRVLNKQVNAGLEVKLLLKTNSILVKDKASIELMGLKDSKKRHSRTVIKSVHDQELAAKQLSKGAKLDYMAELLESMGHTQRIRILLKLLGGDATHVQANASQPLLLDDGCF